MNKSFGFRGELIPKSAFKNVIDDLTFESVSVSIKDGIFEVGYDRIEERERAFKIANTLIASWSKRNNIKINIDFSQSWQVKSGGNKFIAIGLHDEVKITDRVVKISTIIKGMVYNVVKPYSDSYSFANDIEIVRKAEKDETLALALKYFYEEVIDSKRPMYGIHKAIEQIIKHLPGKNDGEKRNNLAKITGKDRFYVDDLMTSIQTQRHSEEWLKLKNIGKIIDDKECIKRATNLIDGYAASII